MDRKGNSNLVSLDSPPKRVKREVKSALKLVKPAHYYSVDLADACNRPTMHWVYKTVKSVTSLEFKVIVVFYVCSSRYIHRCIEYDKKVHMINWSNIFDVR